MKTAIFNTRATKTPLQGHFNKKLKIKFSFLKLKPFLKHPF